MRLAAGPCKPAERPGICRFGKRLEDEIYVASEASATPQQSYAPQSNFWYPQRVSLSWTPGTEVVSSLDFLWP
jgi:hypothetical protein